MGNHWAIAVGISQYQGLDPLPYAAYDASAFSHYFKAAITDAQVYYLSDWSPDVVISGTAALPSQPTFANFRQFMQLRFSTPFLQPDDTLWFFFSGHGLQFANRDYLMCLDSNPEEPCQNAIAIDDLVLCLMRGGTNRIVLLLDACHKESQPFGQGFGNDPEGVITVFACDFHQRSQSLEAFKQGLFTHVVVEALKSLDPAQEPTLESLYRDICDRMTRLNQRGNQSLQNPRLQVDLPISLDSITIPAIKQEWIEIPETLLAKQRLEDLLMNQMIW